MKNILFEATPKNPSSGSTVTVRMSCAATYGPEGVDLDGKVWKPIITEGPKTTVSVFANGEIQPIEINFGGITFLITPADNNESWSQLSWDGATATAWAGEFGADFSEYEKIFSGTCGSLARQGQLARVTLMVPGTVLNSSLLTATYLGTGESEGLQALAGNYKPMALGACQNVAPVLVDGLNSIYQVHGYGEITSIEAVYENALANETEEPADFATYTALAAAEMVDGTYATCLAEGLFRFANVPSGKVTADITGAVDAGTTIGSIASWLMEFAGIDPGDIDDSVLDFDQQWRFYTVEQVEIGELVRRAFWHRGGYVFPNADGVYCAGYVGGSKTAISLTNNRAALRYPVVSSVEQVEIAPPSHTVRIGCDPNWSVHSDGEISPLLLVDEIPDETTPSDLYLQLSNDMACIGAESDGDYDEAVLATLGGQARLYQGDDAVTVGVTYEVDEAGVTGTIDASGVYVPTGFESGEDSGTLTLRAIYNGFERERAYTLYKSETGANDLLGSDAKTLNLSLNRIAVDFDANNALSPSVQEIEITANKANTSATVNWTILDWDENPVDNPEIYLSGVTGDVVTMSGLAFDVARQGTRGIYVVATATDGVVLTDRQSIIKRGEGSTTAATIVGMLSNPSQQVNVDELGTILTPLEIRSGVFHVWLGNDEINEAVEFTKVEEEGGTFDIDADGNYVINSISADTATATFRAIYDEVEPAVTVDRIFRATRIVSNQSMHMFVFGLGIAFNSAGEIDPPTQSVSFNVEATDKLTAEDYTWELWRIEPDGEETPLDWETLDLAQVENVSPTTDLIQRASFTLTAEQFLSAISDGRGVKARASITVDDLLYEDFAYSQAVRDGAVGATGDAAKGLTIGTDRVLFHFDGTGDLIGTQVANVTAYPQNLVEGITFSYEDNLATASETLEADVFETGTYTRRINSAMFSAEPTRQWVRVTVTSGELDGPIADYTTILRSQDGANGEPAYTPYLTNEVHNLPASYSGTVSTYTGAAGSFVILKGDNDISEDFTITEEGNPADLDYVIDGQEYSVTGGFGIGEDTAALTLRATGTGDYTGLTFDRVFSLTKSKTGEDGTNAVNNIVPELSNETHTLTASSAGVVSVYTGAGGTFKVFQGATDITSYFALSSVSNPQSLSVTYDNVSNPRTYAVTAGFDAGEDTATLTIRATGSSTYTGVTIDRVFSLAKAKGGVDGSTAKTVSVIADRRQIVYDGDTLNPDPSTQTTTFTVNKQNTTGTVTWSVVDANGTSRTVGSCLSSSTGDSVTMTVSQFTFARNSTTGCTVTASITDGTTFTDKVSISRLVNGATGDTGDAGADGESAYSAYLTNESHTVPASSAGAVSSYTNATGAFRIYHGTTEVSSSFALSTQTDSFGLTETYNNSANPRTYTVSAASTSSGNFGNASVDTASLLIRATGSGAHSGVTIDKNFTLTKSKAGVTGGDGSDGTDGADAILLYIISDRQNITYNGAGSLDPSSQTTTFTAQKVNTTATVTWTMTRLDGTSLTASTYLSATTGNSVTMTAANFHTARATTNGVIVTGTLTDGVTVSDKISVVKVQSGQDGSAGDPGTPAVGVTLVPSATAFTFDSAGTADPSGQYITLVVNKQNTTANVTWTAVNQAGSTVNLRTTSGGTTNVTQGSAVATTTAYLQVGQFSTATSCTITVVCDGQTSVVTVTRSQAGATGTPGADGGDGFVVSLSGSDTFSSSSSETTILTTTKTIPSGGSWRITAGLTGGSSTNSGTCIFNIRVKVAGTTVASAICSVSPDGEILDSNLRALASNLYSNATSGSQTISITRQRTGPSVDGTTGFTLSAIIERVVTT